MPRTSNKAPKDSTAHLGFEAKLWLAADKLRNNMDAAEYKHVVLGLIFLKYISDRFEEHRAKLAAGQGDYAGANPEDPDEYRAENIFWVPPEARWGHLQGKAKLPTIGKDVDDAMAAVESPIPWGVPHTGPTQAIAFAHGFGRDRGPSSKLPSQQRPASDQVPCSPQMSHPVRSRVRASC